MKTTRFAPVLAALVLAACAHVTPRGDPPRQSWQTGKSLDEAGACLVKSINEATKTRNAWDRPDLTNSIEIIEPGRVYEIRPQQQLATSGELYFVRLTATSGGTAVDLHSLDSYAERVADAIGACA